MMNGSRRTARAFPRLLLALAVVGTMAVWAPSGASAATCQSWGAQPPNVGTGDNELRAVDALSTCSAWAVGSYKDGSLSRTLILHWNGTTWKRQQSVDPGSSANKLEAVAATSATNAWAVGSYQEGINFFDALILRWNGTEWKRQQTPSVGAGNIVLLGVTAISSNNAWAVGWYNDSSGAARTLVLHWNGTAWKLQQSRSVGAYDNYLEGIAATSATNAWAVGWYDDGAGTFHTLILHWNGTAWRRQKSLTPGATHNYLEEVDATSSTNAWAVGWYVDGTGYYRARVLHWNGTAWRRQKSPNVGAFSNELYGVAATSSSNAWAVGQYDNGTGAWRTLVLHWNGTAWKPQQSPNVGAADNQLWGAAATASTNAWAVGSYKDGTVYKNLAIHCC